MKRKYMVWLAVAFVAAAGVCYLGWRSVDRKSDQHEEQQGSDADREIAEKEELPAVEAEAPETEEETLEIVEAEPLAVVEDWAVSEETLRIEGEGFEKPELCGISEERIYFSYSPSDDADGTSVYCMYDRMTKETKTLHELEVRGIVLSPITYNGHMYILDVSVPDYKIWDICEEGTKLFEEGECVSYPGLQLCGSKLVTCVQQQKGADVVCTLSWVDLLTEESAVIETTKYKYDDSESNVANGTEICHAGGWEDGVIYETYSYDEEPRQTWQKKKDYGEQEIWYYDFAAGTTTKQALTLGRHSYYVGGDESCIVIDRASIVEPLPKSGTMYERTQSGYVSRNIPGVNASNSIVHAGKLANGQIVLDCREGFVLIDPGNDTCTGEETFNFTYSDTEIAFVDEDGVVHIRKYTAEMELLSAIEANDNNYYAKTAGGTMFVLKCGDPAAGQMEKILYRRNGMMPFYVKIRDLDEVSGYPTAIAFADEQTGFITVTYHGQDFAVYMTDDGGKSWRGLAVDIPDDIAYNYIDGETVSFDDGGEGRLILDFVSDDQILKYEYYFVPSEGVWKAGDLLETVSR